MKSITPNVFITQSIIPPLRSIHDDLAFQYNRSRSLCATVVRVLAHNPHYAANRNRKLAQPTTTNTKFWIPFECKSWWHGNDDITIRRVRPHRTKLRSRRCSAVWCRQRRQLYVVLLGRVRVTTHVKKKIVLIANRSAEPCIYYIRINIYQYVRLTNEANSWRISRRR